MNKEIPPIMEIEGEKQSDYADILRQVWDERVFIHFQYVKYLMWNTKNNTLDLVQPKTSTFSKRALIRVHYKVEH